MSAVPLYTEDQLIALLRSGTREGFNYLYTAYSAALYGNILHIVHDEETAQDVLQDAFVKIWHNIGKYDATKGRIYTWMLNISKNAAIDKLRSKGEIMRGKIRSSSDDVDYMPHSRRTEQRTDTIGLHKIVTGLRPEYRTIIDLAYYKGYTLDEISKTLGVPLGTVKTRMRAAMQQLRQQFSK